MPNCWSLASQFPHPARNGATIKTASILDYLRDRHDVHLACLRGEELARAAELYGHVKR